MDLLVRQAETKHSLQYARYHEMVPKMMYVQQHTSHALHDSWRYF
jgi:hypothetical protein